MIIEDDEACRNELKKLLDASGYKAFILEDFTDVLNSINSSRPDLVLLDINIPNLTGEFILQALRKTSNIPVIMLTSKNSEMDEMLSMSFGADDYITKPYNPNLLLLRIRAVLKRTDTIKDTIQYKSLTIDLQKGIIRNGDIEVVLTKNEMIIFSYLLSNQERIVSRDELMTELWNNAEYINDNALTVNISRLRSKLDELGYKDMLKTRKGIGYILS